MVNPNNPTGRHLPSADLRSVVDAAPESTRWWVDEAYVGYVGLDESLAPLAATHERLVVCTSLSKMYALSGLRAAFLVAAPDAPPTCAGFTPPWQVKPAGAAGRHRRAARPRALPHPVAPHPRAPHRAGRRARGPARLEVEESVANFLTLTLPAGGPGAARFVHACRQDDVYLRDLSPMSAEYRGRTVRVAVRDVAENARIVAACAGRALG